jgi:hypothetical protein
MKPFPKTESPRVSWQHLRGRRVYHTLDPAMLLSAGTEKTLETRPVPYDLYSSGQYQVTFDRSYAIEKVRSDLTRPLSGVPLADIIRLVFEAYAIDNPDVITCGDSIFDIINLHLKPEDYINDYAI